MNRLIRQASILWLLGCSAVGAAEASEISKTNASCRHETKRVAVWPAGPKSATVRFEQREVTVCDTKASSQQLAKGK